MKMKKKSIKEFIFKVRATVKNRTVRPVKGKSIRIFVFIKAHHKV